MQCKVLPVGQYEANCVILWSNPSKVWVIDPGSESDRIRTFLKSTGLRVGVVILTHGHFDHITAVNRVLAENPYTKGYMHSADDEFAFSPRNQMPPYPTTGRPVKLDVTKNNGDLISCGKLTARIIHTPGHTPGSWCLYFEQNKLLISGDTLFKGSIGRTDFPGGNMEEMEKSLQLLQQLPDETLVIPGHGPYTTIGHEKESNSYLRPPQE